MPVAHKGIALDLLQLLADHLAYVMQGLTNQYENEDTYLLAGGQLLRVELAELQAAEEELDRRCGIAIRRRPDHLQLHLVQVLPDVAAGMVAGAIEQDDCVCPPAWSLLVQGLYQVPQEDEHHVLVGVHLREREVRPALRVQRRDQREPGRHLLRGYSGRRLGRAPDLPDEARSVEPALVDVQDALALPQERHNLECILLPEDAAALGVALDRNRLRRSPAELQPLAEHCPHLMNFHLEIFALVHLPHDLCGLQNGHALLQHIAGHALDGLNGLGLTFLLLHMLFHLFLFLRGRLHELVHESEGDLVVRGNVPHEHVLLQIHAHDLCPDRCGQILQVPLLALAGIATLSLPLRLQLRLQQAVRIVLWLRARILGLGKLVRLLGLAFLLYLHINWLLLVVPDGFLSDFHSKHRRLHPEGQ